MSMKYIHTEKLGVVIFPASVTHQQIKDRLCPDWAGDVLIGAGFVGGLDEERAYCYGESVSLKVKSSPDDTPMLRIAIRV